MALDGRFAQPGPSHAAAIENVGEGPLDQFAAPSAWLSAPSKSHAPYVGRVRKLFRRLRLAMEAPPKGGDERGLTPPQGAARGMCGAIGQPTIAVHR